jgi:tRNA G10  N-methylase Trm11
VYDPFCGTGTIVAEAAHLGLPVFASDVDEEAVLATRQRLAGRGRAGAGDPAGGLAHRVFRHDVLRGEPARVTARVVAANLPWGKQVKVERRGDLFDATVAFAARALAGGGGCALLSTHEDQLAARLRKRAPGAQIATRRIGLLGQTPGIVTARAPRTRG